MNAPAYDLLIKNVRVVRPTSVEEGDIAISGEKFAKIGRNLSGAKTVYDGKGYLAALLRPLVGSLDAIDPAEAATKKRSRK